MKLFKKIVSLVLVSFMTFSEVAPVAFALQKDVNLIDNIQEIKENSDVSVKGNIEIETHFVLPIRNSKDADVKLTVYDENNAEVSVSLQDIVNNASDGYLTKNVTLSNQTFRLTASKRDKDGHLLSGTDVNNNIVYLAVNLYEVEKGNYKIKLEGKNFVTYETEVEVKDFSKRVIITDERGMFEIGDITNDGKVDNSDINAMINAINNKDLSKDLNLDGVVDISDLNYVTGILNGVKKDVKNEDTNAILDVKNISFELDTNTTKLADNSSSLTSIFTDEGVVSLEKVSDEPITLTLDLAKDEKALPMSEIRINFGENAPLNSKLLIELENGQTKEVAIPENDKQGPHPFTDDVKSGTRVIDLGSQIAVKKVTIVILETGNNNLADIAKVEFLNNVKVETKAPEGFDMPRNVSINDKISEQLTVSFEHATNVTGYEIYINGPQKNGVIYQTSFNTFTIEDLKNYANYTIMVRSVNGEWRSDWTEELVASPQATRVPPKVDMVEATPSYGSITFSWKLMDDTKTYNLYYREVGQENWLFVKDITGKSYTLNKLKTRVQYEAYLTGNNDLGEGEASLIVSAKTLALEAVNYPKYRLINEYDETLRKTLHINDVIYKEGNAYRTDEELNTTDSDKWAMVDDDYLTYWKKEDWQMNAHSTNINYPIFELDKAYKMDEFVIITPLGYTDLIKGGSYNTSNNDIKLHYWNTTDNKVAGNKAGVVNAVVKAKYDSNNQKYYVMKLEEPIEANAIQFGLTVTDKTSLRNGTSIQIAEVKFYEYDSLVDDVAALFTDDLRVELAEGVKQETIDALRVRANEMHNGEYNPYRESIINDLNYAEKILKDEKLDDVIEINPNIANSYGNPGFAMTINDYQPLGIAVRGGEQLTIYVGSVDNPNLEVVFTQTHAEAGSWSSSVKLNKGQNIINVPTIGSATTERGGSVYVRLTATPKNPIKVRVSGGVKIPVLALTSLNSEEEKKEAIRSYISELDTFVNNLPTMYAEVYKNEEKQSTYEKYNSALGVTEIATKYGLFSFSAEAVRDAINDGLSTEDEKVERLYNSTSSFDEMMLMFYRHKGLSEDAAEAKDRIPKSRINIRYMTMFDGAFMYAGGYHIGIEYGSIAGVIQGNREKGYFGWGISHEIGHQINQGSLAYAEITNNVFALLAQTADDESKSRLETSQIYDKIYEKVTSHTLGKAQNVFVTLGMYWQLHLAYDDTKTFDDTNSIFARINKEARSYNNTAGYNKDDLLILFASKASGKDLTDYFAAWGLNASEKVRSEIESLSLPKEERAIYYLNDNARRMRLANSQNGFASDVNIINSSISSDSTTKRITLNFDLNKDKDKLLGYEIKRNGVSIAFVDGTKTSYTDYIGAENNRAYTYEIVAYDYLLNESQTYKFEEVKVSHDGSIGKETFSIESNFKAKEEIVDFEDETLDYSKLTVNNLIDGKNETFFKGTERVKTLSSAPTPSLTNDTSDAYVILSLNTNLSICGIKYRALVENGVLDRDTISHYKVYVSHDKEKWDEVKDGSFNLNSDNDYTETIYFRKPNTDSDNQFWIYNDIAYVKIVSVGNKEGISGAEIDLIAPLNDNVDITMHDNKPSIGVLESDYCYLTNGCPSDVLDEDGNVEGIIKANSVIIEGTYTGSPSFNLITINDALNEKNIYGGYFIIFAEVNSDNSVYNVSKGTWLYVMDKDEYDGMVASGNSIRATLYRVNDALTNDDQRITSTSKAISDLPKYGSLEKVTLNNKQ